MPERARKLRQAGRASLGQVYFRVVAAPRLCSLCDALARSLWFIGGVISDLFMESFFERRNIVSLIFVNWRFILAIRLIICKEG